MDADVVTWAGPIVSPAEAFIRKACEYRRSKPKHHRKVALILDTGGGYIETAERIAGALHHNYRKVLFVIPDQAMSAGTVLAMAGDEIWMNYYSTLGPIDPQIERKRGDVTRYLPALGYLAKYEELIAKSKAGTLTAVEAAYLVQNFDAAELYQFEQARDLSIALLKQWLVKYKFKNWKTTKTRKEKVTARLRRKRAEEVGKTLSDTKRWYSHGRGITREVLEKQLKLKIEHIEANAQIESCLGDYWELLSNYLQTIRRGGALHTFDQLTPILEG